MGFAQVLSNLDDQARQNFNPDPNNESFAQNMPYYGMSPEERQYYNIQSQILTTQGDLLKKQFAEYANLSPELMSTIRGAMGTTSNLTQGYADRVAAAQRGELPVDPALNRQLEESKVDLENRLYKELGSGYATSEPGKRALLDWEKRKQELLYGARTTDMNQSFANFLQGTNATLQGNQMLAAVPGGALPYINAGTTLGSAFSAPLNTLGSQQSAAMSTAEKYFNDKMDYQTEHRKQFLDVLGTGFGKAFGK